jgi:uncharacterized membrane protein
MRIHPWSRRATHPAVRRWYDEQWATSLQNRVADAITQFAGSMAFVYIHVLWFAIWIVCEIEGYPYGLLTMIVSLEAIFLSTFVMISQNRADIKRQVVADAQWELVKRNTELTEQLHAAAFPNDPEATGVTR